MVELVSGGSVINEAYPVWFYRMFETLELAQYACISSYQNCFKGEMCIYCLLLYNRSLSSTKINRDPPRSTKINQDQQRSAKINAD